MERRRPGAEVGGRRTQRTRRKWPDVADGPLQDERVGKGVVAVRVMTANCPLAAIVRAGHPDLVEQVRLHEVRVRLAAHLFDDETEEEVGRVVVDEVLAGYE